MSRKPLSVLRRPRTATISEKTNIEREAARIATDEQTIAICRKTSAPSKYGSRLRYRSRSCSSFLASASISFFSAL